MLLDEGKGWWWRRRSRTNRNRGGRLVSRKCFSAFPCLQVSFIRWDDPCSIVRMSALLEEETEEKKGSSSLADREKEQGSSFFGRSPYTGEVGVRWTFQIETRYNAREGGKHQGAYNRLEESAPLFEYRGNLKMNCDPSAPTWN